ncbi:hypothetical protein ARSEF4850_003603 [Beauveria asiatica]
MSMPANHEPPPSIDIGSSTENVNPIEVQSRMIDLERQLNCRETTNRDLRRRLSETQGVLEEVAFERKMLEFDLNQHKEAIKEVLGELRQRDHTIQAQSDLLRASWLDGQALASSQRQMIQALQSKLEKLSERTPGGRNPRAAGRDSVMMLRKTIFLMSLVHIAVAVSFFEAYSAVTPTPRVVRRYRNSTSSFDSDTTIRQPTTSTSTETTEATDTTQISDHDAVSELPLTSSRSETRVTGYPSSSNFAATTADQPSHSTFSEWSDCVHRELRREANRAFPVNLSLVTYLARLDFLTDHVQLCCITCNNDQPQQNTVKRHVLNYRGSGDGQASLVLLQSGSGQYEQIAIAKSHDMAYSKRDRAVEPTSVAALSPTADQSLASITSEATNTASTTPFYSVVSLQSATRTAGRPPTSSEGPFITPTWLAPLPSPATPASTNRSPSDVFTTAEDQETSQTPVTTSILDLASASGPPSPSPTTTTKDAEQTKPVVHASVSPLSTLENRVTPASIVVDPSPHGQPTNTRSNYSHKFETAIQYDTTWSSSTPSATGQQATTSLRRSGTASQPPSESAARSTVSNLTAQITSTSAVADAFANKAHKLQIDDTSTTEMMGPEPTRNATAAASPDTRVSVTLEDTTVDHSASPDTPNEPTGESTLPSQLTTQAGPPTPPGATHSTSASTRTGPTPDSTNDVFANSVGQQTAKQKITIAGAAIGAVSGSALLGAAMFMVSSRVGPAPQEHMPKDYGPQDCMPQNMPRYHKSQDGEPATRARATEWQDMEPQISSHRQKRSKCVAEFWYDTVHHAPGSLLTTSFYTDVTEAEQAMSLAPEKRDSGL